MASVVEKLYPPTIGSSIPAFYAENGIASIAIPFSMNRAVSRGDIKGFRIKIKTVQSNTYITSLDCYEVDNSLTNRIATFNWYDLNSDKNFQKIRLGQYLKVQMAYISTSDIVGYFSTVGVIKYTSRPRVYIKQDQIDNNITPSFKQQYTGVYETTEDKSERPYSYCFFLYDIHQGLLESSGWRLHNTSINNIASESLSLTEATDTYGFQSLLAANTLYYIQYAVKTINNLEVYSPMYSCMDPDTLDSDLKTQLLVENIFEDGCIKLSMCLIDGYTNKSTADLEMQYGAGNVTEELIDYVPYRIIYDSLGNEIARFRYVNLEYPVSIEVCRSSKLDNYESWQILKRSYFTSYNGPDGALAWTFEDFTTEQGITYKYCFRQYTENGVLSNRTESDLITADFEDMFLWDGGERHLRIRFNPKISSFKVNRFEQKIDTIGSKYPFIFRNGIVNYREFPIAGLISYLADNNERFMKAYELDLIPNVEAKRNGVQITGQNGTMINQKLTPVDQETNDTAYGKSWENSQTLDSVGYNMRAERLFKMKLLEWLGNGEIKFFKSPQEGNYLVRLLNISLTPEDRLGRMLHNFSCTAYEVEELTYDNLLNLHFINTQDDEDIRHWSKSIYFKDKIREITSYNESIKINENDIINQFAIIMSNNPEGCEFYVRLGENTISNKTLIQQVGYRAETGFEIVSKLPDVYFNIGDNLDLLPSDVTNNLTPGNLNNLKNAAISLVGDSILTYWYNQTEVLIGEFNRIKNVYIKNIIASYMGPTEKSFSTMEIDSNTMEETNIEETVLRFFVLNFQKKAVKDIIWDSNQEKYIDPDTNTAIAHFDDISIYREFLNQHTDARLSQIHYCQNGQLVPIQTNIRGLSSLYYSNKKYYSDVNCTNEVTTFSAAAYKILDTNGHIIEVVKSSEDHDALSNVIDTSIILEYYDGRKSTFNEIPILNLNDNFYRKITIGNGIYLDCAYQAKFTEYKNGE